MERGARVSVLDRTADAPPGALALVGDVTDDASVRAAVASLDGLDVLVNNAGIGAQGDIEANDDDEWHRVFDVNVVGIARVTRAALPLLRASSCGAIVNTCSVAALVGLPNRALYSATKGAVYSLTLAMAADLLPDGIRVNCVTPGTVDTPWVGRRWRRASRPGAWSRRATSPRRSCTWRSLRRRPAPRSASTAAWRPCGRAARRRGSIPRAPAPRSSRAARTAPYPPPARG